jgi:hypothetical protein
MECENDCSYGCTEQFKRKQVVHEQVEAHKSFSVGDQLDTVAM